VIDENPIRTARRLSRRHEQDRCLLCGRTGVLIELDHTAGRNHDALLTSPLCRACHAGVTELRLRADADMRRQPNSVQRVKCALTATAVFLHMLADALRRWAELLEPPSKV
jgi:hypothetical protein